MSSYSWKANVRMSSRNFAGTLVPATFRAIVLHYLRSYDNDYLSDVNIYRCQCCFFPNSMCLLDTEICRGTTEGSRGMVPLYLLLPTSGKSSICY